MPLGPRDGIDQAGEVPGSRVAVDAPARVLQTGLPLIGKEDITATGEHQVVYAFEAFGQCSLKNRLDAASLWLQEHETAPIVGDKDLLSRWMARPFGQPSYSATCSPPTAV